MESIIEFFSDPNNRNVLIGLSSIGTFIAALVALLTLSLLRRQIKNSQRPNVTFGNSVFGECFSLDDRILKTIWWSGYVDDEKIEERPSYSSLDFELINVGVGFAENVKLHEKFNTKAAIKFINSIDFDNEFEISVNDSVLRIHTVFDTDFERIPLQKEARELGNFKTAVISNNKGNRYVFDDEYLVFLSCFGYLRNKHDELLNLDNFPKLKLRLSFNDIDGKKYKSKFECSAFCIAEDSFSLTIAKK